MEKIRIRLTFRLRTLALLFGALALAGIGAAFFAARIFQEPLRIQIQNRLESALPGHHARVGSFSIHLLSAISVGPVSVSQKGGFDQGTLFEVEKIRLHYRIFDLLRLRWHPEKSLAELTLVRPRLHFLRREGHWQLPRPEKKGSLGILPFRIRWTEGSIAVSDDRKILDGISLKEVSGSGRPEGGGWKTETAFQGGAGETGRVSFSLDGQKNFQASLSLNDIRPENYQERFRNRPSSVSVEGRIDLELGASGAWPWTSAVAGPAPSPAVEGLLSKLQLSGNARLEALRFSIPLRGGTLALQADGNFKLLNDRVEWSEVRLASGQSSVKTQGTIRSWLKDRSLEAQAEGSVDLKSLATVWGSRSPEIWPQGALKLRLEAGGLLRDPSWKGAFTLDSGAWRSAPLSATGEVRKSSAGWEFPSFLVNLGSGRLAFKGSFPPGRETWELHAARLPLQPFFQSPSSPPQDAPSIGGSLFADLKGSGWGKSLRAQGPLRIQDWVWGESGRTTLRGQVRYLKETFLAQVSSGQKGRMALELARKKGIWVLRQGAIQTEDGGSARFYAQFNAAKETLKGSVRAESVSARTLDPLLKSFRTLQGRFSLIGSLEGSLKDPRMRGTLAGTQLSGRGGSEPSGSGRGPEDPRMPDASAHFIFTRDRFELTDFAVGPRWTGRLAYDRRESVLSVQSKLSSAEALWIWPWTGARVNLAGATSGYFEIVSRRLPDPAHGKPAWTGSGDLAIRGGRWGKLDFEKMALRYRFEPGRMRIEEFRMEQKEGALTVRAEAPQTKEENPLRGTVSFERFRIGQVPVQGDFEVQGRLRLAEDKELRAQVRAPLFTVNQFGPGWLEGDLALKGKRFEWTRLNWGDFFKGSGKIEFQEGKPPSIEAQWTTGFKEIEDWNKILRLGNLRLIGQLALAGKARGSLPDADFSLDAQFANFKIRPRKPEESAALRAGYKGIGKAQLSKGVVRSLNIGLENIEGGRLTLLGQVDLKTHQLTLDASFQHLEAGFLFDPLGWRMLKGKSEGRLNLEGAWEEPVAKGEIKGEGGALGNLPLESWEVAGRFQEKEFFFTRLNILGYRNSWRFSLLENSWIRPQEERRTATYRMAAEFLNLKAGPATLVGSAVLEGGWKPSAQTTGSLLFYGKAQSQKLLVNQHEVQPFEVHFEWDDKRLRFPAASATSTSRVKGEVDFSKLPAVKFHRFSIGEAGAETFWMDGTWSLDHPAFQMRGRGMDAALVGGIFKIPFSFSGRTDFSLDGTVEKNEPVLRGDLKMTQGRAEEVPVDSLEGKFAWKDGTLILENLSARTKSLFEVTARGRLPLSAKEEKAGDRKMDFVLRCSNADLSLLNYLKEETGISGARGSFSGAIAWKGSAQKPKVDGQLRFRGGELDHRYFGRKLKGLDADLKIQGNRVAIQEARASLGDGRLSLTGGLGIEPQGLGFNVESWNLKLETLGKKGVPIQVPQLPTVRQKLGLPTTPSRGSPRALLELTGNAESPRLAGWVELEDTTFSYPPPKSEGSRGFQGGWDLDLALRTGRNTFFQNEFVYCKIDGALQLKGHPSALVVSGRVRSNEGTLLLYGSKFDLKDGLLEVVEPRALNLSGAAPASDRSVAYLQFTAEQNVQVLTAQGERQNDTITLQLQRTPLNQEFDPQKLQFRSAQNPNLPSEKVATRSGLGVDMENQNPEERDAQLRQGIAKLLDSQLASPLARSVLQRTGLVDKIEISQSPAATRDPALRGTRPSALDPLIGQSIFLERRLGSKLGVGYRATFDRISDRADFIHQLELRYPFYKNLWLYGSTELDSRENLGREPERVGGVRTQFRFDPSEWFKKKEEPKAPEKK